MWYFNFPWTFALLYHYIIQQAAGFGRTDIICGQSFENNLKEVTCKGRGSGTNKIFDGNTNFPDKFQGVLKQNDNKEYLNRYLAEDFQSLQSDSKKLTITYGNNIKTTDTSLLLESCINDYNAEEVDPRLVRYAIKCVEKGYKKVVVRTVDKDAFYYWVIPSIWMKSVSLKKRFSKNSLDLQNINKLESNIEK